MKVLNLYACLGGNRLLWEDCEVTAIENDLELARMYQEIILLETVSKGEDARFKGKYVVENVIPYYDPLIQAQKRGRHLYWANFLIPQIKHRQSPKIGGGKDEVGQWCEFHKYDFRQYKGDQPMNKITRNLVDYEAGKTIFNAARGIVEANNSEQESIIFPDDY